MKPYEDISAVILAGGRSSRMGTNKAELSFGGMSLITYQVKKLRAMGIEDIILSGFPEAVSGARPVGDLYPLKGPLGGIHAGLTAATNASCLVISVDVPLVPELALRKLIRVHLVENNNITVLTCNGILEPLIGVYDRELRAEAERILQTERTSVRRLFKCSGFSALPYTGAPQLLRGCNTPEEYRDLLSLAEKSGFPPGAG